MKKKIKKRKRPALSKNGTKMITLHVTPEEHALAKATAKRLGSMQSRVWARALRAFVVGLDAQEG